MEARTLLALVAILAVASTAAATTHIVGGATGWTIPPNATFYSVWASTQAIFPGDSLVFNFAKGAHDVAKVPKASYDACTTTNQLGSTLNNAPATVTVAAGTHYYICAVPGHCSAGQKLAVTVAPLTKGPAVSAPAAAPAAPSVAPKASPVPAAAPGVAVPTASTPSLSPTAAAAAGSTADAPTAAAGPSNGSNSATELRSAAGAVVAVLAVAAASMLI